MIAVNTNACTNPIPITPNCPLSEYTVAADAMAYTKIKVPTISTKYLCFTSDFVLSLLLFDIFLG